MDFTRNIVNKLPQTYVITPYFFVHDSLIYETQTQLNAPQAGISPLEDQFSKVEIREMPPSNVANTDFEANRLRRRAERAAQGGF